MIIDKTPATNHVTLLIEKLNNKKSIRYILIKISIEKYKIFLIKIQLKILNIRRI